MTNAEFADPETGKGLVLGTWARNPTWVQGSNCCNQFAQNLVKDLGLHMPSDFDTYVADAAEYAEFSMTPFGKEKLPPLIVKV